MKGLLEFDLPVERDEFALASNAGKYHSALWNFKEWLHQELDSEHSQEVHTTLEKMNKKLLDVIDGLEFY